MVLKNFMVKEIFGSLRNWKIDLQKTKDQLRKDWNR